MKRLSYVIRRVLLRKRGSRRVRMKEGDVLTEAKARHRK
jgi:hypothetical protein